MKCSCLSHLIFGTSFFQLTLLHDKLTVTLYHLMMCALQNKSHSSEVYLTSPSLSLSLSLSLFLTVLLCRLEAQSRAAAAKLPLHSASAFLSSLLSPVHHGKLNNPVHVSVSPIAPISIFFVQWAMVSGM